MRRTLLALAALLSAATSAFAAGAFVSRTEQTPSGVIPMQYYDMSGTGVGPFLRVYVCSDGAGGICATGGGGGGGGTVTGATAPGATPSGAGANPFLNGFLDGGGAIRAVSPTNPLPTVDNLAQLGGVPISLNAGATDAGTQRVVANQGAAGGTPWPVQQQDGTTYTLSGSAAGPLTGTGTDPTTGAIPTKGFASAGVQFPSFGTSNNVVYEGSNDGTTWAPIAGYQPGNTGGSVPGTNDGGAVFKLVPLNFSYFRLRIQTYGSGTMTAVVTMKVTNVSPLGVYATLAGGTATIGALNATNGGNGVANFSRIPSSAASTNLTTAKASAGRVYKIYACNTATTDRYIKFYNSTSPTVGTSTVFFSRALPRSTLAGLPNCQVFDQFDIGWYFSTGISYALTAGNADADTTALAAGDVIQVSVEYQ